MTESKIPMQYCWKCAYRMTATTETRGEAVPRAGDISICIACGAPSIFTKELYARKPTPEEELELAGNAELTRAQIVRAAMIGDQLKKK